MSTNISLGKKLKYTFWGLKGNVLVQKKRFEKAIKNFNEMIEMDPTQVRPFRDKLYLLMHFNRYEEALDCVDALLGLEPDSASHHYVKGSILSTNELHRYEEAIQWYEKAIALEPDYDMAYLEKGIALMNLNRDDEALSCFDRAISIVPEKAYWAYCHKAIIMNKQGKYKAALALSDSALATDMGKQLKKDLAFSLKEKAIALASQHGES